MSFKRLLHTETGKYFISILLGLGLASLFRKACNNRSCIKFHAPPVQELERDTYKIDDKCYKYSAKSVKCDASKKQVEIGGKAK
jgi:hypothetical protein